MPFQVTSRIIRSADPKLPNLPRQALNAGRAFVRAASAVLKGEKPFLTAAKSAEQQAICQSNTCGFFRAQDSRCAHPDCGCFTKLKTRLATERCPAGLFGPGIRPNVAPPAG